MRTVTLTLEGDYWDAYLYAGQLFLFETSGRLEVVNFDELVESAIPHRSSWLNVAALKNSNWYLAIRREGERPSRRNRSYTCTRQELREFITHVHEAPGDFPHISLHVYNYDMYVGGRTGLYCIPRGADPAAEALRHGALKVWDGPAFDLDTSLGAVGIAAGEEGVFEMPAVSTPQGLPSAPTPSRPHHLSNVHCSQVGFLFASLYATSIVQAGELLPYRSVQENETSVRQRWRSDVDIVPDELARSFSFAKYNRIAYFSDSEAGYYHYFEDRNNPDAPAIRSRATLGQLPAGAIEPSSRIVRGGVSSFGFILETVDGLILYTRDGVTTIDAPAQWRVLPRAMRYHGLLIEVSEAAVSFISLAETVYEDLYGRRLGTSIPRTRLE